jgi:uncharacterized OB-fold protein
MAEDHEKLIRSVDGVPHLIAGRRLSDDRIVFPMPEGAAAARYQAVELPSEGRLWSFTVQRFQPKTPYAGAESPQDFTPFAVGYVEFEGLVIVEGRIVSSDFDILRIGMPMRVTTEAFIRKSSDSSKRVTKIYAFEPCAR